MPSSTSPFPSSLTFFMISMMLTSMMRFANGGTMDKGLDIAWGDGRGKFSNNGELLTLSLDKYSGSGFQSKKEYLFGRIDMQIKLVAGNSAGTVTTFFLSSQGETHDEIDFEFLGNLSGNPYTVHTNVYTQGKGDREQQFHLWFDPTTNFHKYSILWNQRHVIFLIDDIPIRDFKNMESKGIKFPSNQPMRMYSSLWNADDWATMGGLVKADWSNAPFTASYRNFEAQACEISAGSSSCSSGNGPSAASLAKATWLNQELDSMSYRRLRWVQRKYMIYNYCADTKRFPGGLPPECKLR